MRLDITFNDFFGIKKPERWKGEFTILLLSNLIPTQRMHKFFCQYSYIKHIKNKQRDRKSAKSTPNFVIYFFLGGESATLLLGNSKLSPFTCFPVNLITGKFVHVLEPAQECSILAISFKALQIRSYSKQIMI